ncbi:MAG: tetratricopeptide repeat protein [Rhodobacteraceae bacterium]|nr:tetratricopeptide repeat protein [Paracoccaceae bacterium]
MRQKHPELYKGDNGLLEEFSEIAGGTVGEITGEVLADIPGLGLLFKISKRLTNRTQEWLARRGKHVLAGLDQLDQDAIAENLPRYLGADICDLLAENPSSRITICLDTFEALWRDYNSNDTVNGAHADEWVRNLVQDAPGVLFLIFGRDKLRWDEIDKDWAPIVDSHSLGKLSDQDADQFLAGVPIEDADIREKIVSSSGGLPFYLDLQVSQYADLSEDGVPQIDDFAASQHDVLPRFWNHLSDPEREIMRYASYPHDLSEPIMNRLALVFPGALGQLNWGWLARQSFISLATNGDPVMHNLMRQMAQDREQKERPERWAQIHTALFDMHDADAQPSAEAVVTTDHEAAFDAALRHKLFSDPKGFWDWFNKRVVAFESAYRSRYLERVFRFLYTELAQAFGEAHPQTLLIRSKLLEHIGNQGRFAEAEAECRAVLDIYHHLDGFGDKHPHALVARDSLARQIIGLGRYGEAEKELQTVWEAYCGLENFGEVHSHTLAVRHNLAGAILSQGRYAEAETVFRAVWNIQRRSDNLGEEHPHTLITRHSIASIIGDQGRFAEAEAEFRAIWNIQRRLESLGEAHRDTLTTRHNLAYEIGRQGRNAEAEAEMRAVWDILRQPDIFGEAHPQTIAARHGLAQQIGGQGRYAEAEAEFRAIWDIQRQSESFGTGHSDTDRTCFWIGKMLDAQGNSQEADKWLGGLEDRFLVSLSDDHKYVKELRAYIGSRKTPD